jgi:hypothetical protein
MSPSAITISNDPSSQWNQTGETSALPSSRYVVSTAGAGPASKEGTCSSQSSLTRVPHSFTAEYEGVSVSKPRSAEMSSRARDRRTEGALIGAIRRGDAEPRAEAVERDKGDALAVRRPARARAFRCDRVCLGASVFAIQEGVAVASESRLHAASSARLRCDRDPRDSDIQISARASTGRWPRRRSASRGSLAATSPPRVLPVPCRVSVRGQQRARSSLRARRDPVGWDESSRCTLLFRRDAVR